MAFFKSVLGKIKDGLTRTREVFAGAIRSLLIGRILNDQVIGELETALLQADVGVVGTRKLIDGIREGYKAGKMSRGEDVLDYMKRELKALWPPEDRRLREAPPGSGPTVILVTGINGAGKTTSIAKLCSTLRRQDKKVLLAACDTSARARFGNSRSGASASVSRSSRGSRVATPPRSLSTRARPRSPATSIISSSTPPAACRPRTR